MSFVSTCPEHFLSIHWKRKVADFTLQIHNQYEQHFVQFLCWYEDDSYLYSSGLEAPIPTLKRLVSLGALIILSWLQHRLANGF